MLATTFPKEGRSQSNGQHQTPSTTRSTPLPVMCGALVVSCTRYGVSDTNHLKDTPTYRSADYALALRQPVVQ